MSPLRVRLVLSPLAVTLMLVLFCRFTAAFLPQQQTQQPQSSTRLNIGNLLGKDKRNDAVSLPRDVKDAVSKCREAVQRALQNKCSRMDIEMPVGAKFGVEKGGKSKTKVDNKMDGTAPTRELLDRSDRELARLFVEMFQPVGGANIAAVFNTAGQADLAREKWKGEYGAECRILALDRKKGRAGGTKKKTKAVGFAAKMAAEIPDQQDDGTGGGPLELPGNIEVALFVAPGPKELVQIERICDQVGMGTLVVLLNARLSSIPKFPSETSERLFRDVFEPVFALKAAPQQEAPGCLLHRSYPGNWVLARKPKVGPPKPILTQMEEPTPQQCQTAYDALELSDVEKGIENVLENVAGWFN